MSKEYDCLIEARQTVEVRSPVEGVIETVHLKRGADVKKGQLIASLQSGPERAALDLARSRAVMEGEVKSAVDSLDYLRTVNNISWTFFSPAGNIRPGTRTGKFRLGTETLVVDEKGQSAISMEDYAVAMLDEVERPQHVNGRFTVGY